MKSSSGYVLLALGFAAVALLGYVILSPHGATAVIRPPVNPGGGIPSLTGGGAGPAANFGLPLATGSVAAVDTTPNATGLPPPPAPALGPAPGGALDLSWIFPDAQSAFKAGLGSVYRDGKGGFSVIAPNMARAIKDPSGTIYASANDAKSGGFGSIYQQGGSYYVLQPNAPVKLSSSFQPHTAAVDLSSYGSVSGIVRGWTTLTDRLGNVSVVPAHSVQGSTYTGDAVGAPPSSAELSALSSARGSLPVGAVG